MRCLSTQIHRAVGEVVAGIGLPVNASVYELSSRGALVGFLRRSFVSLFVSEFFDDVPLGGERRGVSCQDVQALTLTDGSFDLITSTEVFEHVPDDRQGFREIRRVLKDGGWFVFTVPLRPEPTTLERANLTATGRVEFLTAPEYHADRLRGRNKVLAFRTYGADIVDRLTEAGFCAEIHEVNQPEAGILRQPVLVARKRGDR